jgi:hypothetical protein
MMVYSPGVKGMRRAQVQMEEDPYELLRQEAFCQRVSVSELVRRILRRHLASETPQAASAPQLRGDGRGPTGPPGPRL